MLILCIIQPIIYSGKIECRKEFKRYILNSKEKFPLHLYIIILTRNVSRIHYLVYGWLD